MQDNYKTLLQQNEKTYLLTFSKQSSQLPGEDLIDYKIDNYKVPTASF